MSAEIIVAGAAVVGVLITGYAQIKTWKKNGKEQRERDLKHAREQSARDATIAANQKNIIEKLEDPKTGLPAVNEKVNKMTTHCAEVSTGLTERVIAAERDIKEVKSKHSRSQG